MFERQRGHSLCHCGPSEVILGLRVAMLLLKKAMPVRRQVSELAGQPACAMESIRDPDQRGP